MNYPLSSDLSLITLRQRRAEDFPRYQSWEITPPHSDILYTGVVMTSWESGPLCYRYESEP